MNNAYLLMLLCFNLKKKTGFFSSILICRGKKLCRFQKCKSGANNFNNGKVISFKSKIHLRK